MRITKVYLTIIVVLFLALSMVNAVPLANKISSTVIKPVSPQIIAPYIHVNLINVAPAAPGNSKPVNVSVNVVSRITQRDICGLNASNFMIEGPAHISNVYPISAVAVNQPMTCDYWLSIVPTSPWVTGIHAFKLDYIQGGKQIANTTLVFRV